MTARETGEPVTTEVRALMARCETIYVEMRTTVSTKGSRRRVRTVLIDVSDRKRAELELAHRAVHDPLTDLPNRALLQRAACRGTDRHHASDRTVAQGSRAVARPQQLQAGQRCARPRQRRSAARSKSRTGCGGSPIRHDTVARLGGDEFAVLMPRADEPHALEFAASMCVSAGSPVEGPRRHPSIPKVSIGIATRRRRRRW